MGFRLGPQKLRPDASKRLQKPPKGHFFFANIAHPRVPWTKMPNLRKLYFYCVILIFVNIANGFDGSMMNSLQSLPLWQEYFDHPEGTVLGLFGSSMSLGSIAGFPVVPYCCDRLGRKMTVIIGSLILILGTGLQAGALNFGMFWAGRFILGLGMVLATTAGPLLCAELAHPQDRAILTTFMGCSYAMGSFVASWVTLGTLKIQNDWAWRTPSLLQCWATIIVLCIIYWIPESPRWYMARDQHDMALKILAKYHGEGNEHDPFVQLEYTEIKTSLALDKEFKRNNSWADFLKTKGNRHRISLVIAIAVFGQWSGNGILAYYLKMVLDNVGIKKPNQQLGINGGSKTMSLLVNIGIAFFIDRAGRRPILMASTLGMTLFLCILTTCSGVFASQPKGQENQHLGRASVAVIYMYNFCYNLKTGMPLTYTTEIMPYGLRAKAAVIGGFATMVCVFFNQFVNPSALKALAWKYYLVYCAFLFFEIWFVYFFVVETRYVPMEEIAKYFDGEEADVVGLTQAQTKGVLAEEGEAHEVEHMDEATRKEMAHMEVKRVQTGQ